MLLGTFSKASENNCVGYLKINRPGFLGFKNDLEMLVLQTNYGLVLFDCYKYKLKEFLPIIGGKIIMN